KASKSLFGLKIFASRDLPYRTQVTPMAAILAVLGDKADTDNVRAKLAQWYWCGVFGELYGSAVETQFAKDVPEFLAWLDGGPEPTAIAEANFSRERLLTLKTRNSAAYKGLYALLLKEGGLDLRSGETINQQSYFDEKIDIHHILTLPTKVSSDSLGRIGSLKRTSDKSLFPMALGSCGHRITHQL